MPSEVRFTHIGGPTVLIETGGWRILTDPTFDRPGRRYSFGYGSASRKEVGPAVPIGSLGRIDAILLTHDHHADNLDDLGRTLLPTAGRVLTTEAGGRRLGYDGLRAWESTRLEAPDLPSIEVTATPCRHGPPLSRSITGEVIGFVLRWEGQQHGALWVSGDTVLYDDVRAVATRADVGTVLLHLGAVQFGVTGPLKYTMAGEDGVELCEQIRPHTILPVHYEGWSHFREGREGIEKAFAAAPPAVRDALHWLPIGKPEDIAV
jgi:L-ascorbate metabolism protein UlaG (beta-lactamase superfamily)